MSSARYFSSLSFFLVGWKCHAVMVSARRSIRLKRRTRPETYWKVMLADGNLLHSSFIDTKSLFKKCSKLEGSFPLVHKKNCGLARREFMRSSNESVNATAI